MQETGAGRLPCDDLVLQLPERRQRGSLDEHRDERGLGHWLRLLLVSGCCTLRRAVKSMVFSDFASDDRNEGQIFELDLL
jgi:hypothetical protein